MRLVEIRNQLVHHAEFITGFDHDLRLCMQRLLPRRLQVIDNRLQTVLYTQRELVFIWFELAHRRLVGVAAYEIETLEGTHTGRANRDDMTQFGDDMLNGLFRYGDDLRVHRVLIRIGRLHRQERTGTHVQRQFFGQLIYFFAGAAVLVWFIPFRKGVKWFSVLGVLLLLLSFAGDLFLYLEPLGLALVIVTIAYYARFLNRINRIPDLTYGLYLYHFPIAQTIIAHHVHQYSVTLAFSLIFATTILVSWLSYRFVESKFRI